MTLMETAAPLVLLDRYRRLRTLTRELTRGLAPEDQVVQTITDVSPTKWHLAHTTWFFETFVLGEYAASYRLFNERYPYLFNSYYVQAGARHCRSSRGYLTRPTVEEIHDYRDHVDAAMEDFLAHAPLSEDEELRYLVELGIHHEQQHQELILTDLKHVFSVNPLRPVYRERPPGEELAGGGPLPPAEWVEFEGGIHRIGWEGDGFAYDNEGPPHRRFLEPFALAHRPVSNLEFLEFMQDGGYRRPELWMSEGWAKLEEEGWESPFYWEQRDGEWWVFTLSGMRPLHLGEPVSHVNWFEADAFARWAGARLPREEEWEIAAGSSLSEGPEEGHFVEEARYHPQAVASPPDSGGSAPEKILGLFGDVWEWTESAYRPYPGFRPAEGAVGEYNGKFMVNQFVLRGGSCVTSLSHIRPTYRNFFHPEKSWQFTGLRLAKDL